MALPMLMLIACGLLLACSDPSETVRGPTAAAHDAMIDLVGKGFRGSVLVACNGEIVLNANYGLPSHESGPVRYSIASVTKGLTATAVMTLVEDGKVSLTDRISKFFPDAPVDKRDITLLDLLTHGSGLPQAYAAEGHADPQQAAQAILAQPLVSDPGSQFGYSNDNFSLLAIIIQRVAEMDYAAFMSKELMRPLGLTDIAFWPTPPRGGEYIPTMMAPRDDSSVDVDWGFRGGHGARLSVDEIYALTRGILDEVLISDSSVRQMLQPRYTSRSGLGVAMGWFRETDAQGRRLLWMRGSDSSGGNALAYVVEDADVVIVSASNAGPDLEELRGWSQAARDALMPIYAPVSAAGVRANCH